MLEPLREILLKSRNNALEMDYIIDWLSENEELYNKIKRMTQGMDLFETDKGHIKLPMDIKGISEDDQFLEAYKKCTEIKGFYDLEPYYKSELVTLKSVGDNKELIEEFYLKNREIYDKDVFSFFIEYVSDYIEDDNIFINLNTSRLNLLPQDFQYVFQFSKTFEDILNSKNYEK